MINDSAGYRVTKEIYINVVPKSNTRPIIYADNITVALGEKYNPYAMVSASDKEDGDITGKIIVVYNYVNVMSFALIIGGLFSPLILSSDSTTTIIALFTLFPLLSIIS